ncbi:AI-2E family transporter [Kribbella sp. CA-245084]|uniref:AI-2E family transporter n=1 Tax=Kribbella sp. CA-245084 TaxID=3239940 RepID=UPI003D8B0783
MPDSPDAPPADAPNSSDSPVDPAEPSPGGAAASWSLPRGVVVLLGLAGAIITAGGLHGFSSIAGPVFLALILTIAVSPLRRLLIRRGVRPWIAALIAIVVVIAILVGLAAALALSIARLATLLPTYRDTFGQLVNDVRAWLADLGVGDQEIQRAVQALDLGKALGVLQSWLTKLLGVFSDLGFIVILLFFMGMDANSFTKRLTEAAKHRPGIASALTSFARGTTRYLVVSTIFGLIVAVVDVGVLYVLSVPLPWLWGLLAFITNYIPNIGFIIGVVPPALLALLDNGWSSLIWVIVAYCVINFVFQSIIQPKVVGDAVGMSTTLTFLSLVFWAWVLGPLGAILAIPLSLLAKALLLDADPSTHWVNGLISSNDGRPEKPLEQADEAAPTAAAP